MPEQRPEINPYLILRAQLGDRTAMDRLLLDTASRLRPYLIRLMIHRHDAEDALQGTLLLIWKRLYQLDDPRAYWAWAYRIASREGRRQISRKQRRREREAPQGFEPAENPPEKTDEETIARLLEHISELPANTRDVILLHYSEGFSIRLISAITAVPVGTVKSRLNTALRSLRRSIEQDERRQ